jgi:hypothetical protein
MKNTFFFEIKRIFQLKNIFILCLFFTLALYAVYLGTWTYKDFLREKKNFLNFESQKVTQYINYEQYGFHGFRVLFQPSPLIVFCHSCFTTLKSNIDIKDIVDIDSDYKGQKIFTTNGMVGDFSTVFFVLGSLLMLYFGLNTFTGAASLRFHRTKSYIHRTICSRLVILSAYFLLLIQAAFFFAKLLGVPLAVKDAGIFLKYSLYGMLFITFFYVLGIFLTVIFRFNKVLVSSAYLVWFVIIFAVPLIYNLNLEKKAKQIKSNETVNIEKLNNGKDFERKTEAYFKKLQEKKVKDIRPVTKQFIREYLERILPLNTTIETNLNREVKRLILHHEDNTIFAPSSFYCFLSKEFSSMGYYGYQDFLSCILKLKDGFYRYYFDKRYNQIDQTVEPFVKNNENIFLSKSFLPGNYRKGVLITFLYCLLLLAGTLKGLQRTAKPPAKNRRFKLDINQLEMGKTYFYFSRNVDPGKKNGMIHYLESQQAVIIEKPDSSLYDPGISLKTWVQFESGEKQIDPGTLGEYLEVLGITGHQLDQRIKNLDNEILYTAYLGIQLAQNTTIYVCDDFLDRVSREFEQTFKEAVDKLLPRAIIIYFGSQMFDITVKEKHDPMPHVLHETEECRFVAVDLNDITLR